MPNLISSVVGVEAVAVDSDKLGFFSCMFGGLAEPAKLAVDEWMQKIVGVQVMQLDFYRLSNGGHFVSPGGFDKCHVESLNDFKGEMSPQAAGVVVCLYLFSHLAYEFGVKGVNIDVVVNQYVLLRDYAVSHAEATLIFSAAD